MFSLNSCNILMLVLQLHAVLQDLVISLCQFEIGISIVTINQQILILSLKVS